MDATTTNHAERKVCASTHTAVDMPPHSEADLSIGCLTLAPLLNRLSSKPHCFDDPHAEPYRQRWDHLRTCRIRAHCFSSVTTSSQTEAGPRRPDILAQREDSRGQAVRSRAARNPFALVPCTCQRSSQFTVRIVRPRCGSLPCGISPQVPYQCTPSCAIMDYATAQLA